MNTTRMQKLTALTLTLGALASSACSRGADTTAVDSMDPGASAQAADKAQSVELALEQAERKLDVGREIPAARAALSAVLKDPAATPDQRDRAKLDLSRVLSAEGDQEGATRAVEALLAEHSNDPSAPWALHEAADRRLRKLVTGTEEEPKTTRRQAPRPVSSVARALASYFGKAEPGKEINVQVVAFGGDNAVSERLGTFEIDRALRDARKEACSLCDENLSINTTTNRTSGWTAIPLYRPRLSTALAVYYVDLGAGRVPARYDAELPIPSAEINAHLERGRGLIAARERPGAPPVLLIAAPRRAQLAAVEEALADKKALPTSPEEVQLPGNLQPEEIQDVVRADGFPAIHACYDQLLQRSPAAFGSLPVKFVIQANGAVTDAAIDTAAATIHDATFDQCVIGVMSGLTFPAAPDKSTVTYPISFSPGE